MHRQGKSLQSTEERSEGTRKSWALTLFNNPSLMETRKHTRAISKWTQSRATKRPGRSGKLHLVVAHKLRTICP